MHKESYQVKGYDVMPNLLMKPTELVRAMHDGAIAQVVRLGLSASELQPLGLGWALVHQHMDIMYYPKLGEELTITTYPSGKHRIYTYRDYRIHGNGQLLAQASTVWVLLDIRNHKLAPYPDKIEYLLKVSNLMEALPRPPWQPPNVSGPTTVKWVEVQYSDIDFNGHVSNQSFFKWMLDALPIEFLRTHLVVAINVKFKGEAFMEQKIEVLSYAVDDDQYYHELKNDGVLLVQATTKWMRAAQ